jgi:methylmalonyl-CoA mutase N-terminal domain/subunit
VGKVGVAIDCLDDMEALFEGISPEQVTTSMTINATAAILLAMYVVMARRKGVSEEQLGGTVQNDILKEYAARGTYIYPPAPSMRLVTDLIAWCAEHMPRWNTISISGYHMREAGCTAAQEVGFTLANGIAYVQSAVDRGLDPDRFGRRLSFFFNSHNDLFEEVAKFRAARRLWATVMKERFGCRSERAMQCRFHTQTAGSTLTAQQPENNVVRVTVQALAAVLGGTQSLHTNSFDEALSLPTEASAKTALRTQQILAYESGVANVVDPLGGSYYIEHLTDRIESEATTLIHEIDQLGGAPAAIEGGYYQERIAQAAYAYQLDVEHEDRVVVGVNRFRETEEVAPPVFRVDEEIRDRQRARIDAVKGRRDAGAVEASLDNLRLGAAGSENVMPLIMSAVEADATLGEISDSLRAVWGEYAG